MGYESSFNYNFSGIVEIKDVDGLNRKISKLDSGMSEAKIKIACDNPNDYAIEMSDYYGKFYDDRKFAELLSTYLVKGSVTLTYDGEDGSKWGYEVYPGKVVELDFIPVPTGLKDKVNKYIKSLKQD
ncbi:MAG: hypothetical protein ACYCSB_01300 [bacterium]|jgi:hypothetical protein